MLLLVNVDDISGEILPFVIDGLMSRGANSVHVVPALTKKGRSEFLFFIDAESGAVDGLATFLASELGTLGVRVFEPSHIRFEYRFCSVLVTTKKLSLKIMVKQILDQQGRVISVKAESDELAEALKQFENMDETLSLVELKRMVEQTAAGQQDCSLGAVRTQWST